MSQQTRQQAEAKRKLRAEQRWGTMRIIDLDRSPHLLPGRYDMRFGCDICGAETDWLSTQMIETGVPMPECPYCANKQVIPKPSLPAPEQPHPDAHQERDDG